MFSTKVTSQTHSHDHGIMGLLAWGYVFDKLTPSYDIDLIEGSYYVFLMQNVGFNGSDILLTIVDPAQLYTGPVPFPACDWDNLFHMQSTVSIFG